MQVVIYSSSDKVDDMLIVAECHYQPYEEPEYDGGMPSYPCCNSYIEVEGYECFDNITGEIVDHELTAQENEMIVLKGYEMIAEERE